MSARARLLERLAELRRLRARGDQAGVTILEAQVAELRLELAHELD